MKTINIIFSHLSSHSSRVASAQQFTFASVFLTGINIVDIQSFLIHLRLFTLKTVTDTRANFLILDVCSSGEHDEEASYFKSGWRIINSDFCAVRGRTMSVSVVLRQKDKFLKRRNVECIISFELLQQMGILKKCVANRTRPEGSEFKTSASLFAIKSQQETAVSQ